MNVLLFTQYFWPESFPINNIAKSLLQKGVKVDVLTGKPNYPIGRIFPKYRIWGSLRETYCGICVHRIPLFPRGHNGSGLIVNYLSFVIFGILFSPWLLRRKRFDVIFVYAPSPILQAIPAIFLGWIKGCPVVIWVQDLWPESLSATGYVKNSFALRLVKLIVRFIYSHADLLLVQSKAFIGPVTALASDTPVEYYPNSVEESNGEFSKFPVPDILGLGESFSVMFAGNIGHAQAVEVILDAATLLKAYPSIKFLILGDGSRRDWMLKEVKDRGLTNLCLPGRFPVETMPSLMGKASILLVTLADKDIFNLTIPSKVQTYLAAARPILACLNGEGAKLVVDSGAGLTVPAENPKALAEAILHLYQMPSHERDDMGAKGRLYYEQHFSHDMLINQLINHFQLICSKNKEKI